MGTGTERILAGAALLLAMTAGACGAPESEPARGPIGAQLQASMEKGRARFDHDPWESLLKAGTRDGLVDYRLFQENRPELEAYLDRVAGADLASLAPDHLKALLINAYNAYTVRSILDAPSVSSIREIDGVWKVARHRVGGFDLTLDEMEHNLLRPWFKDPRIHFAVNCASASCAPLPPWAYDGDRLEGQLEERSRAFLSDSRNVSLEGETLRLSRYFDWYGEDFTQDGWNPRRETIPAFVAAYSTPEIAEFIRAAGDNPRISFLDYDWSLNALTRPVP